MILPDRTSRLILFLGNGHTVLQLGSTVMSWDRGWFRIRLGSIAAQVTGLGLGKGLGSVVK